MAVVVDGGLYGPGSEAWRLNREAMLLLGAGPRALLMQLAHPLIAAGVDEHSDFRADPWRRLAGTLRSYLRIVYGTAEQARSEIGRLNDLHRGIRGAVTEPAARARHGRRYAARDPELALWVHATLVDATIVAYDTWIEPLSDPRRERFYQETRPIAAAFGIPDSLLPRDLAGFEAYLERMTGPGGEVEVGDVARELSRFILHPPLGPAAAMLGEPAAALQPWLDAIPAAWYDWLFWPSIGLLPDAIRSGYGLRWGWRERVVSAWLVAAWQAWRPVLPVAFRTMPQALAADRRVEGALEPRALPSPVMTTISEPGTAVDALLAAIRIELPDVRLLTDVVDRESYRLDETAYLTAGLPAAIALPSTTAEVSGLLRLASTHRVAVVPRGAGTGLSGGAAGLDGALTIALTRMDRVIEIDRDNLCVITQPGVINAALKAAVAAEGLFYPPDPASYETCSIGGNLGTNAGGLCCVKYGQTRDWVLGLEVVLADGTVIRTGGRNVKDTAGYSLTHLFIGSQGTLGIITEATLRLRPLPGPRSTLLAFFGSVDAAGEAVATMTRTGLVPVTLELLDHETILAVDDVHQLGLDREAAAMLMVESDAAGAAAGDELDAAEAACAAAGATSMVRAADATEADWLRQARRLALRALERQGTVRMEDVGVPRARVPDLLRAIQRISAEHGVRVATFGHAGDGNLHPNFIFERADPDAARLTHLVRDEIFRAALAMGGTVTAEHGIGAARREWLPIQRGEAAVAVMRAIKTALDPLGILNPGRVI